MKRMILGDFLSPCRGRGDQNFTIVPCCILVSLLLFSAIAVNLKACNHFRLYNGKAAEVTML